ncbi:processive 1,2-diacylglycerol beta-glucosyltransferase [Bacillus pakistanensis]|uniref:Processive 1,2-diacylglycerol beta-glucosyltransferase n=1 Tax=Rossellomorea pakistanensis TaxID=992288 RepID=A0ABS2N8S4_9BACI|nr:glycosyltransferase [Bacillus pakistanensis]MBM7584267.1 processive 1,2-diacylglycerol beta-glucosyltransferase [Bacillus pakistanensis]
MYQNESILILTAQYGEGHIQTAQTVASTFLEKGFTNVHIIDLYGEAYPAIHLFTQGLLKKSFTKFGAPLYKMFYYGTDKLSSKGLAYFYQHLGKKRLLQLLQTYQPSFILTTFPLNASAYLRNKTKLHIPTFTIITDYCAHPLWTHPMIERYYVASHNVKETLIRYGIKEKRILITGIPIRSTFTHSTQRISNHYKKFNLDENKKTITIFGGGFGIIPKVQKLIKELESYAEIQLVIICGKNITLKERLDQINHNGNVHVYGYIDNIHELFSITDCLVSKAGAISLTEAVSMKIPIVLFRPNPGQEMENARYFQHNHAAMIANKVEDIIEGIYKSVFDEDYRRKIKKSHSCIYKESAASKIQEDITSYLSIKNRQTHFAKVNSE